MLLARVSPALACFLSRPAVGGSKNELAEFSPPHHKDNGGRRNGERVVFTDFVHIVINLATTIRPQNRPNGSKQEQNSANADTNHEDIEFRATGRKDKDSFFCIVLVQFEGKVIEDNPNDEQREADDNKRHPRGYPFTVEVTLFVKALNNGADILFFQLIRHRLLASTANIPMFGILFQTFTAVGFHCFHYRCGRLFRP